ncbi:two-component sensor histidine kinase [Brevibacterium permense]|uniref:sensor histidine kinase n=1 Tax=Brevibacterium permense TaxID=234834 RepID=UPI0021D2E9AA|nr:histidine kinase [Brevibacterium permense]MCU4297113.1 two-component sensor histidine kinase [Brevibacterium permense]
MPWPSALSTRLPLEARMFAARWVRSVLAVVWGGLLCLPLLLASVPPPSSRVAAKVRGWELARHSRGFGLVLAMAPTDRRFLLGNGLVAGIAIIPTANLLGGFFVVTLGSIVQGFFLGGAVNIGFDMWSISQPTLFVGVLYGAANLIGAVALAEAASWAHGRIDAHFVEVERPFAVYTRISELLTTRSGVVLAIDEERRRIERDLHDGVQQNVVSLSVLIARARRASDPAKAEALLDDALVQSQDLIDEMREVAWRVYPTALDEHGLRPVLERIADRSPVPLTLETVPDRRFPPAVESAAYFVVREAVTNVVKHAEADAITVGIVAESRTALTVTISDDGVGGADPGGGGLQGLARRVGALDGSIDVDSVDGAGTTVSARIPLGTGTQFGSMKKEKRQK